MYNTQKITCGYTYRHYMSQNININLITIYYRDIHNLSHTLKSRTRDNQPRQGGATQQNASLTPQKS